MNALSQSVILPRFVRSKCALRPGATDDARFGWAHTRTHTPSALWENPVVCVCFLENQLRTITRYLAGPWWSRNATDCLYCLTQPYGLKVTGIPRQAQVAHRQTLGSQVRLKLRSVRLPSCSSSRFWFWPRNARQEANLNKQHKQRTTAFYDAAIIHPANWIRALQVALRRDGVFGLFPRPKLAYLLCPFYEPSHRICFSHCVGVYDPLTSWEFTCFRWQLYLPATMLPSQSEASRSFPPRLCCSIKVEEQMFILISIRHSLIDCGERRFRFLFIEKQHIFFIGFEPANWHKTAKASCL